MSVQAECSRWCWVERREKGVRIKTGRGMMRVCFVDRRMGKVAGLGGGDFGSLTGGRSGPGPGGLAGRRLEATLSQRDSAYKVCKRPN